VNPLPVLLRPDLQVEGRENGAGMGWGVVFVICGLFFHFQETKWACTASKWVKKPSTEMV